MRGDERGEEGRWRRQNMQVGRGSWRGRNVDDGVGRMLVWSLLVVLIAVPRIVGCEREDSLVCCVLWGLMRFVCRSL